MPMFNKRHYEAVAQAIQEAIAVCNDSSQVHGAYRVAKELRNIFNRDNPAFKPDRFERACQPGANVRART